MNNIHKLLLKSFDVGEWKQSIRIAIIGISLSSLLLTGILVSPYFHFGKTDNNLEDLGERECYAVICGVSRYFWERDLQFADEDAEDIYSLLVNNLSVPEENVKLLINENARLDTINFYFRNLTSQMDKNDYFLFFFSGHGGFSYETGQYVLVPSESYQGDLSVEQLETMIQNIPGTTIMIIDSCQSGAFGTALQKHHRYILTSCLSEESSLEDPVHQNGVFTYSFLCAWDTATDQNSDGSISFEEVFPIAQNSTIARSTVMGDTHHPREFDGGDSEIVLNYTEP